MIDNGIGFNLNHVDGLGLAGMRERVLALKGEFIKKNDDDKGSSIYAWLPLRTLK